MIGHPRGAALAVPMAFGVSVLATIALATPVAADVTMVPSAGTQGGALKVVFRVTEDRAPAYTTRVDVYLPAETPIAEVYPMSVPHWAPKVTMRTLDDPVEAMHGTQVRDVASMVSWKRVAKAPVGPSAAAELVISLGPLPETDTMVFTVAQRYSDGAVVRWADPPSSGNQSAKHPAPTLSLRPRADTSAHGGVGEESNADAGLSLLNAILVSALTAVGLVGCWVAVSRLPRSAWMLRASRSRAANPGPSTDGATPAESVTPAESAAAAATTSAQRASPAEPT